jgi:hypothetical protein
LISILSVNPGHDGTIAFVKDGALSLCFEAEKTPTPGTILPESISFSQLYKRSTAFRM